jgi:hypothetical protein
MAAPLVYANGAVITYNSATGTFSPTTGLQLDGLSLSTAVPETIINTPTISGLHLVTVYIRVVNPASGGASPSSTLGPATVFFTCADCLIPVTLITGMLLQDGTFAPTNSDNTQNTCLSGSVVVNALEGDPISISLGYASSGSGFGGKVDIETSSGAITGFLVWIPVGSGYTVGDVLQVAGGNNDGVIQLTSVNSAGQPTGANILTPGTGYSNYTVSLVEESSTMAAMKYSYHVRAVFIGALPS